MTTKLFVAVLAVLAVAVSATAGERSLTDQVRNFEHARRVERAIIEAMIDPPGSFAVTYWTKDAGSQCPINPAHAFTITLRPDIDGTYINAGCPHEGPVPCFCDIFVRNADSKLAWEDALEPYQREFKRTLPIDPSPDAKVQSSSFTYTTRVWDGPDVGPFVVDLAAGKTVEVTRGTGFKFTVDALVPEGSQSPCADTTGRPCRLTTELWQVMKDGSREMLRSEFEIGDAVKVWLQPGKPAQVSLEAVFPHPKSMLAPIPTGRAVLVATWFLWKYRWSMVDYQIPVGGFEVPLNIR